MNHLLGLAIGVSGGFLGGVAGLGGGIVMIPLMTTFARLTQHRAHGTSLVAVVFTGAMGAVTYFLHGTVDWRAALVLAVSAIVTARLGALFAHSLPERKLKKAFGVFLICVSLFLIAKRYLPGPGADAVAWVKAVTLIATGLGTGLISGMMGVGGGAIMIPGLVILAGMEQHLAQGTSLLAMVPIGLTGAFTHYRLGNVAVHLAAGLAVGAAVGAYFGGSVANFLPEFHLRLIFAALGIWMGLHYVRV
jgi:uncharacterized membrane protein YfcA